MKKNEKLINEIFTIRNINLSRIISGIRLIGQLDIEDFKINYGISQTIVHLEIAQRAYNKSTSSLQNKYVKKTAAGNLSITNGFFDFVSAENKKKYDDGIKSLDNSPIPSDMKLWKLKTSFLCSLNGINASDLANCMEIIDNDGVELHKKNIVDNKTIIKDNISQITQAIESISNMNVDDFNSKYEIASTLFSFRAMLYEYKNEIEKIKQLHIKILDNGNYSIVGGMYEFKSDKDKKDFENEIDTVANNPISENHILYPIKTSMLSKLNGIKGALMSAISELIEDDAKILD